MQGFTSYFIDQNTARQAVELCLPTITAAIDSRMIGASGFLYIVILKPEASPATSSFADAILYEHAIGDPADWDADYGAFARAKAELSWRTGLSTRVVQQSYPHLLAVGDSMLWGGIVVDRLTVAVSGADPWYDEAIAGSIAYFLFALAKKGVYDQGGQPWLVQA